MTITTPLQICPHCAATVHPETFKYNSGQCDGCYTKSRVMADREQFKASREMEQKAQSTISMKQRAERFLELCPEQYRDNDTSPIKDEAYQRVLNWKYNPRGLLCMGESRRGKTTTCWKLLEKIYVLQSFTFEAMSEPEFSQLSQRHNRSKFLDSWLDGLTRIPVLFLDDIGHSSTTSRHLEELYYVIEKRTSWKKPVIATTQFTGEELTGRAKGMGGEKTLQAIVNRLRASSSVIVF